MFNLSKKQVKALLDVASADDSRPVLEHLKIDLFNDKPVLVTTNSYTLAALELSDNMREFVGKMIHRAELTKWYKLAATKDMLTEADLIDLPDNREEVGEYPIWQKLIPEQKNFAAVATIGLNARYMLDIATLADEAGLVLEFYGKMSPVVIRKGGNLYIIMPLKV